MKPIIKVNNVTKIYKIYDNHIDRLKEVVLPWGGVRHSEFKALDDLCLSIYPGEAVGFIGKNGAGKSTLLKILSGVVSPSKGDVEINGKVSAILELGVGFNPEFTGIENIYLNGMMMGFARAEMDKKIGDIIDFADIGEFIKQPIRTYSSGMFARLAFAVAINVKPDILIIDEVLAVGDTRFQIKCIDKMKSLKESGTTIIFVSHATEQIKRFCNKAAWIKNGQIEMIGDSSVVVDHYEDFMKNNDNREVEISLPKDEVKRNTKLFAHKKKEGIIAEIVSIKTNKKEMTTFDKYTVSIEYNIYEDLESEYLLGVAIYTPEREYIFGPNTFLENVKIPSKIGTHKVNYIIEEMPLLAGTYTIDVGLFTNEGLNCIDYKEAFEIFNIYNEYISEGKLYIKHCWEVIK